MGQGDWTALHTRLDRTLRQRQLVPPHGAILVAVSGGQDSLCLLKLLLDLQPKWQWRLGVVHCDHRWRTDSSANAAAVSSLAASWGLPCYLQVASVIPTSEAIARQWRYACCQQVAQAEGYSAIATGHTASDRAETLLFNLFRGSGLDGLQSLGWQRFLETNLSLIRPLLSTTRSQTAQFCQDLALPVWEDSTNQDLRYTRNRIRQELLPYLSRHFNPQTETHLAQTMELLNADLEYLESAAIGLRQAAQIGMAAAWQGNDLRDLRGAIGSTQSGLGLNRLVLEAAALALQRRAVRQFLRDACDRTPNFQHIEKFTALIRAPQRTRSDPFQDKLIAEVIGDWIWLLRLP